jgi:hypothetical protein
MKKEKKVVYGIEITKPWSKEMYAHNEAVAEVVKATVHAMWIEAYEELEEFVGAYDDDCDDDEILFQDVDWDIATEKMVEIQKAVTCYGFGDGYTIGEVADEVARELEMAPLYRLNEMAEELGLELEKEIIGFK